MPIDPEFENISKNLRPDALSFDHRTVFTLGPVAVGNVTQGVITFPWKVRHDPDTLSVYFCRANDDNTDWLAETLLFTYDGTVLGEIDAAFDQAGRVFVCGERDGSVWAYYFNPTIPGFSFEELGEGRTPRAILDNPRNTSDSDVIVFYMNDDLDCMCYRVQKDRYQVEYETPVTLVAGKYTEDATRTTSNRVQIYYSERNFVTGRYAMKILLTTLYPVILDPDAYRGVLQIPADWDLDQIVIVVGLEPDEYTGRLGIQDGWTNSTPLIILELPADDEQYTGKLTPQDAWELILPIINQPLDHDDYKGVLTPTGTWSVPVVVISRVLYDIDQYTGKLTPQSGWLLA